MASQTAKGSGSTKNNGGVIVNAGNHDGSLITVDLLAATNDLNGSQPHGNGSRVIAKTGSGGTDGDPTNTTNPDGIQTAKGTGTLAYFPARADGNWIVRAAGETAAGKINNTATGKLHIPAAHVDDNHGKHPLPLITTRTNGVRAITVTAVPSTARHPEMALTGGGAANNFIDPIDQAATTLGDIQDTRTVPGELTYMFGGKTPKQDNYKARDTFES